MRPDAHNHVGSLVVAGAVVVAGLAWSWGTHDPVADGDARYHLAAAAIAGGLGLAVAGVFMEERLGAAVPVAAGALVYLVGALAPHAVRLASPVLVGGIEAGAQLRRDLNDRWHPTTVGPGSAVPVPGGLALHAPARGGAYVALDGRDLARDRDSARALRRRLGLDLIARDRYESDELLAWRASYLLDGTFLTVLETDGLLIQLAEVGLLVQARPDARAPLGDATVVRLERAAPPAPRELSLSRNATGCVLLLDGAAVWRGPRQPPLGLMRLGEPRPGADHAGSTTLMEARYERRLAADRSLLSSAGAASSDGWPHAAPLTAASLVVVIALGGRRIVRRRGV